MTRIVMPPVEPPNLWPEIERRLAEERPRRQGLRRLAAAAVALGVVAASGSLLWRAFTPSANDRTTPGSTPLDAISEGWTRLPDPPEVRRGAAYLWIGTELLAWGGCVPGGGDECAGSRDGYAFDPVTMRWSPLPPAPEGAAYARPIWTGEEAIFVWRGEGEGIAGAAYEPRTGVWRSISEGPRDQPMGPVAVWTGSRLFVWGGGGPRDPVTEGVLYDPAANAWTQIAPGPIALNQASGVWTGDEVIVFGSLLDSRNRSETETSIGAAYDPDTDAWRMLPPSDLSPQAVTAVWTGSRMLAWDYDLRSQEYDARQDAWSELVSMPLEFNECYPDSLVLGGTVFAFFCGQAALYEADAGIWRQIQGGLVDEEIWSDAYERDLKLWRFAELVPAGPVAFLAAEGLTLDAKGVACYGCHGSPTSLWAYRPAS